MSEKCDRCGEEDEDRRTLWMACFYAMEEMSLPFKQEILFSADLDKCEVAKETPTIEMGSGKTIALPGGSMKCKDEIYPRKMYTLRVCKDCRGDWMEFIKTWFNTKPVRESCGSGIFIRENGTTIEITEEEWRERHGDEEPVRVAGD